MIEVGYDLGLFKLMATASGPLTVDEISQQTSADPRLLSIDFLPGCFIH